MRITLVAVGRAKAGAMRDLFEDFAGRLNPAQGYGPLILKEVEERRPLAPAELKRREAALLRAAIPAGARLVALEVHGKALSSEDFAARLGHWRDEGLADLAFIVGGAEGLDPELSAVADLTLSLGPMTWPHMLVRVLLAEQLFRAQSILTGHPYHRG
jgi:23S rRNA (pseudouridine1915-N3)-methyltransferase